jgi:Domain of unknown function (DUF4397)
VNVPNSSDRPNGAWSRAVFKGGGVSLLLVTVLAGVTLGASPATASMRAQSSSGSGWLRFGHFVASAPPVDVQVDGTTIGTGIGFRDVTGYVPVHSGDNSVAVYATSAGVGSTPVATVTADVPAGGAVTVAAFASTGVTTSGTGSVAGGVTLQVFTDNLSPPPAGDAKIRVIHTIPGAPVVDTDLLASGASTPAVQLSPVGYKQASPYSPVAAGIYQVVVKTTTGTTVTEGQDWQAVAGTVVTVVIVEAPSGPSLEILSDAAGTAGTPNGAMQTGFGGTAQRTGLVRSAMLPVAGALIVLLVLAYFLRRSTRRALVPASVRSAGARRRN